VSLPRVTQIIRAAGLMPDGPWYTGHALDKGRALHAAIALHQAGTLDPASIDPQIAGRFAAYDAFLRAVQPDVLGCEVEGSGSGYAGRCDLLARIDGALFVLDAKPSPAPWHAVQLAAYQHQRYPGIHEPIVGRRILILTDDGRYRLIRPAAAPAEDWSVFLAALRLWHWRTANQITQPGEETACRTL